MLVLLCQCEILSPGTSTSGYKIRCEGGEEAKEEKGKEEGEIMSTRWNNSSTLISHVASELRLSKKFKNPDRKLDS